ncbi:MAG: MotA/TolQ/ExbB proton channel family protein [Chlamydiae bacterium]|nr:MotA/TolQ/ExbB proton channel family protein [Chlamydiota bacterium]
MSILIQAFLQADFFGKLIFFMLFFLSILTWYLLVEKIYTLYHVRSKAKALEALLQEAKSGILAISINQKKHPFLKIFESIKTKTIEILDKNHYFHQTMNPVFLSRSDIELIEGHAQNTIVSEAKELEKNLFLLGTIVSLAPFVGILGTVWGILVSFAEMQKGSSVHANSLMLAGISTALATTVLGLVIAIPALVAYNYLKTAVKDLYFDMNHFSGAMLNTIELQYRKVE